MANMQKIINLCSKELAELPSFTIEGLGQYEKLVYFFDSKLLLAFYRVSDNKVQHNLISFDCEEFYNNHKDKRWVPKQHQDLIDAYQEWYIENSLLG